MFKTKKEKNIFIILIALILIALSAYFICAPKANIGAKDIQITVNHLDGTQKIFNIKTDAEYLRQALEEIKLVDGTESEYGLWIETVDGETADADKEQWWGYDVNGEMAMYGVDSQPVNDGDVYEFTLNVGY